MHKIISVLLSLLAVTPMIGAAQAGEREFDLGFARPGMMQGQFRFGAWPPGMAIYCSDDPDKPKELDRLLFMPQQMLNLGATRCALMKVDDKGHWSMAQRKIAGYPLEMSATFAPDMQGTRRLVQLFMTAPREGYAGLVRHFTARFGNPTEDTERMVHWITPRAEALVMHEEGDSAMAMLIDSKLQDDMNKKLDQAVRRK